MKTYRFSDEATSETREANSLQEAVESYLEGYDTADMEAGETFTAKVFDGEPGELAKVTVAANGKGGVQSWAINP